MKYPSHIKYVELCKYCTDYKGAPKPIPPEYQHLAKKMPSGDYMCFRCQTENMLKLMRGKS